MKLWWVDPKRDIWVRFPFSIKCRNSDDAWAFLTQHLTLEYRVSVLALVNKYTTLDATSALKLINTHPSVTQSHSPSRKGHLDPGQKIGYLKWKFGFEYTMEITLNSLLALFLLQVFWNLLWNSDILSPVNLQKKI